MGKKIAGAVLVGGRSSRLKTDKTKLCLHASGVDMLHHTFACVHAIIDDCWLVCRKDQSVEDLPYINDVRENAGPIAGIVAALTHAKTLHYKAILAISCDLPLMQASVIRKLLDTWESAPESMLTAFYNRRTHKIEMLAAIYGVNALPLLSTALANEHFKLKSAIPWSNTTLVFTDAKSEKALFNLNTPAELTAVQNILAKRKSPTKCCSVGLISDS